MKRFLFLPGTLCTNEVFSPLQTQLEHQGHQCLNVDYGNADSLTAMTEASLRLIDGHPVTCIAFSMGGMVAFELLRRHPQLITGLVLVATNAHADKPGGEAAREAMWQEAKRDGLAAMITEQLMTKYLVHAEPQNERLIIDMAEQVGLDNYRSQLRVLANRPASYDTLSQHPQPTLFIAGELDPLCPPSEQQQMLEHAINGELQLIAGASHFVSLDQPDACNQCIMQWINNQL